jgi:hypothetical protein
MYLAVEDARPATIAGIARASDEDGAPVWPCRRHHNGPRPTWWHTLGATPALIDLGAVVRRAEADMARISCFEDSAAGVIGTACSLNAILRGALAAFLAVLDRYTPADLVTPRQGLRLLLDIESALPATTI